MMFNSFLFVIKYRYKTIIYSMFFWFLVGIIFLMGYPEKWESTILIRNGISLTQPLETVEASINRVTNPAFIRLVLEELKLPLNDSHIETVRGQIRTKKIDERVWQIKFQYGDRESTKKISQAILDEIIKEHNSIIYTKNNDLNGKFNLSKYPLNASQSDIEKLPAGSLVGATIALVPLYVTNTPILPNKYYIFFIVFLLGLATSVVLVMANNIEKDIK